jgi:hypothetical protein
MVDDLWRGWQYVHRNASEVITNEAVIKLLIDAFDYYGYSVAVHDATEAHDTKRKIHVRVNKRGEVK